eukprot:15345335-Ditylum_brightwellii.AAC.2
MELRATDRFPFSQPMTEWSKYSTTEMKAWLMQNIPFANYCLKVAKTQRIKGMNNIRDFFPSFTTTRATVLVQKQTRKHRRRRHPVPAH